MASLKKKTTFIWAGSIVGLTVIVLAVFYFFHLQNSEKTSGASLKGGQPVLSNYIQGSMENPLDKPMDVTTYGQNVYVSDTNHQQIQVFDSNGKLAFKFGKKGTGDGQFQFPYGITADSKGNIYVADLYNGKISIFSQDGKFIKYFTYDNNNAGNLASPAGLRIFNNDLFVTDIKSNRVLEYSLSGKKLLELTAAATSDDTLNAPNGVTIDADKNIYVSDTGNARLIEFNKKGKFIRIINGTKNGKGDTKFVNPRGIGVMPDGTVLMVDNMTHFVYGFDNKGKQKFQFGGIGSDNNQFYLPNGLFVDSKGKVFITDTINERIAVYN
jgi:sugar lactone lactonase YvrE